MTKQAMSIGVAVVMALSAGGTQSASAKEKMALTETDTIALGAAETACANQDFRALFEAMVWSNEVRTKYSAPEISVVRDGTTTSVPAVDYDDFPIALLDYSWATRSSVLAWETNPGTEIEDVEMDFNQSQADQWTVGWQQVVYGPASEDDITGEVIERVGEPGVLSFEPFDGCWRLIEDFRGEG